MRLSITFKRLLPALALLVSTSAFAASKGSFNLYHPATLGGYQLASGEYQAKWEGTGPDVQLSILSHGKLVTTVPARLIELNHAEANDATELTNNADGSQTLNKIDFAGKKYQLDFQHNQGAESMPQGVSN